MTYIEIRNFQKPPKTEKSLHERRDRRKEETTTSIQLYKQAGSYIQSLQDQDKHKPNDVPPSIIPHNISNFDPFSLTFNIKTSFTLSIDDEYCPYYTQGFNLLHESRTSKSYTQCTV